MEPGDLLVRNARIATMESGGEPWGVVPGDSIAIRNGSIAWMGPIARMPSELRGADAELDAEQRWVTPGLVDCHTHLVFGGDRAREFEQRLEGASYEEIARAGGGILSTVQATRSATEQELVASGARRLGTLAARGVTTVEIKSGYGLDLETELRMLAAARSLDARTGVRVRTTLLGAHALPPEYVDERAAYVRLVCERMIPAAAAEGLADAVDAFGERIAFTPEECGRVFEAARAAGLPVRLHADQLSDQGGAALAASHGARSADHLEHTSEEGVRAMAAAGTAAVLLPGAAHFLRDATVPPVASFRAHGVPMAVATDLNPGSSPLLDPLQAMGLACLLFRLTPEEALAGMTRHAARVLGLEEEIGTLAPGKRADLVCWDVGHPSELAYWMGAELTAVVVRSGVPA